MTPDHKPVIFLAFANDRENRAHYLRNLPGEAERLRATLDAAAQAGLCEVLLRQNVTVEMLLDVFQDARYRNRIAIFHYGGHAESYALLLETAAGQTAIADAGGLAAFLGQQTGIQLVFLNGCSSQPQAQGLLDAGVAAVIATSQAIDDAVAVEFAARFYKGLASGATLQTAFHEAAAACQTARGNQPRHLYFHELLSDTDALLADRWPWALTARPGAELALHWNLPEAVHDPLFGLPKPPRGDLPDSPYRYLNWYRREDAEVFFGRGYDIRELYQRVTAPDTPPLILYYGQSGVGKSSLLAAGLLPRLEQVQTVRYTRRDQALGLAGTLAAGLPEAAAGESLLARWRDVEAQSGQPLTLILDQVEEAYTRPNPDRPGELEEFLDLLTALFRDPAARPQGRLILSFRKEWLAEIEKLVAERQLPRAKVFLQRLERRGVIETITGPARVERLRQHFGLTVSDDLPGEIADDLLADPSSAVTTTLQVLLSKLWEQAKERDYDHPTFDRALYHELRRQGLLLSDFLDQQLAALRAAQPGAVESGLVFDLLAFHTTPQSTAEQRALTELRAAYAHQDPMLPELLDACQNLYLLTDPAKNQPDVKQVSRLAHDTLAPLVRHRFDESDAPGQRARRILESRLSAAAEASAALEPLGEGDLALVEAGQAGMRAWREPEENLIGLSRAARERRRKRDRVIRGVLMALVCVIVVVAGVAAWQWGVARREAQRSLARQLGAQAQIITPKSDPVFNTLSGIEAVRRLENIGGVDLYNAVQSLRTATNLLPRQMIQLHQDSNIVDLAFAPDSQILITLDAKGKVSFIDLNLLTVRNQLQHSEPGNQLVISQDGTWGAVRGEHSISIWRFSNEEIAYEFQLMWKWNSAVNMPTSMAFSPNGDQFAAIGNDGVVHRWDTVSGMPQSSIPHDSVTSIAYSPDGHYLISAGGGKARLWQIAPDSVRFVSEIEGFEQVVTFTQDGSRVLLLGNYYGQLWTSDLGIPLYYFVSPSGGWLSAVTISDDGQYLGYGSGEAFGIHSAIVVDLTAGGIPKADILHDVQVETVDFGPVGSDFFLSTGWGDGLGYITNISDGREIARIFHDASIVAGVISPNGKWVATAGDEQPYLYLWRPDAGVELERVAAYANIFERGAASNTTNAYILTFTRQEAIIWDMDSNEVMRVIDPDGKISYAGFFPDGERLAVLKDAWVEVWDISTQVRIETVAFGGEGWGDSSIIFNCEGDLVAFNPYNGDLTIRRTNALDQVLMRIPDLRPAWDVVFSPDKQWIAIARGYDFAQVWDIKSGQLVAEVTHKRRFVLDRVAFAGDGSQLITHIMDFADDDSAVYIWALKPDLQIAEACNRLPRNLTLEEWKTYFGNELYRCTCQNLPPDASVIEAGVPIAAGACPAMLQP